MIVIIIIIAAIAGALIYWYGFYPTEVRIPLIEKEGQVEGSGQGATTQSESEFSAPDKVPLPKASANIDGVVNALIDSVSVDQSTAATEDNDNSFLSADSKEITDFGQSYNETDF
jgi:hypothetical protein